MLEKDFLNYINAEIISFYSYKLIIKQSLKNEYVDIIGRTYGNQIKELEKNIGVFYLAKNILKNEYNTDIYSLPFYLESFKLELQKYDLVQELGRYFDKNKILYKENDVVAKAKELSFNDHYITSIINKLDVINQSLKKYDHSRNIDM